MELHRVVHIEATQHAQTLLKIIRILMQKPAIEYSDITKTPHLLLNLSSLPVQFYI